MRVDHTVTSRSATTVAGLLVLVQLVSFFLGKHDSYVGALLFALVLVTAAAVAKLHRDNCLESRVALVLLAVLSGGGVVLTATAGLPGQPAHPMDALGTLTVCLSIGVLALLAADQPRRAASRGSGSPYAS